MDNNSESPPVTHPDPLAELDQELTQEHGDKFRKLDRQLEEPDSVADKIMEEVTAIQNSDEDTAKHDPNGDPE